MGSEHRRALKFLDPHRLLAWVRLMRAKARRGEFRNLDIRKQLRGDAGLWLGGLLVGLVAGHAAIVFRLAIQAVQFVAFGDFEETLVTRAQEIGAVHIWLAPIGAGVVVALLLRWGALSKLLPETRPVAVADVIEARAVGGRIKTGQAFLSAGIAAVSLGGGASNGREGPAVHLGAALATMLARWVGLSARDNRTILACGAAAAVAASFNAPIAGAVFALEVVLGHYALRVIAPVAAASTVGALSARFHLGDQPAFTIEHLEGLSLRIIDFPAAAALGVLCALAAIVFMRATFFTSARTTQGAQAVGLPLWSLPIFGGVVVGTLALMRPEVLGVGYEATASAIAGEYAIESLLAIMALKLIASAVSFGCRFGGGVFSPSLFLGAVLGAAVGAALHLFLAAANPAPASFYAVVGMGALSGAVLGAPLSTTLIVFEMTNSYETAIGALVAVSLATVIVQRVTGANFFQRQIEAHGYVLREGPQRVILQTVRVKEFMTPIDRLKKESVLEGPALYDTDTLGKALGILEAGGLDGAPVKARGGDEPVVGYVTRSDALVAYNRRLVEAHIERSR